jgi:hypothetical protein
MVMDVANASTIPTGRVQLPQKPLSQAQNQLRRQDIGGFT